MKQDLRPNRAMVTKENLHSLISHFYEQNPLSKISIIATMREKAIVLADFLETQQVTLDRIKLIDDFEGSPSY